MRRAPVALLSGIGRRVAWAVISCGLAVLVFGLLLQAGKQQRQYRELHQQQLRQSATQAALTISTRITSAEMLLRAHADSVVNERDGLLMRSRLLQSPLFEWVALVDSTHEDEFIIGARQFRLAAQLREAVEAERSVLLTDTSGAGVYLLRALPEQQPARWIFVKLSGSWLWAMLQSADAAPSLLVIDADKRQLFSTMDDSSESARQLAPEPRVLPVAEASSDLAWSEQGQSWVGAVASVTDGGLASELKLSMVALDPDRPWSAAFWSALRTQSTMLPLLLLLAAWFAHALSTHQLHAFRQLRRALAQLPGRRIAITPHPALAGEVRQLVDSYNRCAEIIETQAETRKALDEIDGLLVPGGDYENVIDQVLTRVRGITRANNVGLTLIDPGISRHGRLFAVNSAGGFPVNRVALDEQMIETLRAATRGLTIVRCEEGRHSFLEPLRDAGSGFFWVWPVAVAGELAAILSIGYVDPPANGARIASCGTHCAQRLGVSLLGNARAEQLYRQAHFDPLTQLPNRLHFRDQLAQELRNSEQSGTGGALLFIDLDHFKKVNDSLGHEAGDQLLAIVAQRLCACVKDNDTVARLGGDEFTVILRGTTDAAAVSAVAERMIQSMQLPVRLGDREHRVRASIGIALFPTDGNDLDGLLRNADLAMYRAKDLGRGAAVYYNAKMADGGPRPLESGLFRALKRREFSLYFQPQYRVSDGALVGVEALLRWQKPRAGLLPSAEFVPAAEESGLITDIGSWVIDAACAQIALWNEQGVTTPRVAINLSVQQLRDAGLVEGVRRALDRHGIRSDAIEFEMNEAALTDVDGQSGIEGLSALGVRLTLDDFGTGHTSLANLRRYPVDAVKIDGSFVRELVEDPAAAALASTIIVMAHSLGKKVVAEGVETNEQLDYLRERGCDFAQGYFMARPLSVGDMTAMLLGRNPDIAVERSASA